MENKTLSQLLLDSAQRQTENKTPSQLLLGGAQRQNAQRQNAQRQTAFSLALVMLTTRELIQIMPRVSKSMAQLVREQLASAQFNPLSTIQLTFWEQAVIGLPATYSGAFRPPPNAFQLMLKHARRALQGTVKLSVKANPGFLTNVATVPDLLQHIYANLTDVEIQLRDPFHDEEPLLPRAPPSIPHVEDAVRMLVGGKELKRLVLDDARLTHRVVPVLLDRQRWSSLEHLEIHNTMLVDTYLEHAANNGPDAPMLQTLKLTGQHMQAGGALHTWMMKRAPNITSFWSPRVAMAAGFEQWIHQSRKTLQQLVLYPLGKLEPSIYQAIWECKNLEVLQIGVEWAQNVRHEDVQGAVTVLLQALPRLRIFGTSGGIALHPNVLPVLLAQFGKNVEAIRYSFPSIRDLSIPSPVTTAQYVEATKAMCAQWKVIPGSDDFRLFPYVEHKLSMPNLRALVISDQAEPTRLEQWNVTDWNTFVEVIPEFPSLVWFMVKRTKLLTPTSSGLIHWFKSPLTQPKTLDDVFKRLTKLVHLRHVQINLGWTSTFTANSVFNLVASNPQLETFQVFCRPAGQVNMSTFPLLHDMTQSVLVQMLDVCIELRILKFNGVRFNIGKAEAKRKWTLPSWPRATWIEMITETGDRFDNDPGQGQSGGFVSYPRALYLRDAQTVHLLDICF